MKKTREEQEVHDLDELFERYRQAPESYVFVPLADACRKIGRIEEALEICEHGVRRHPSYASGHVVKGKCFYDSGDRGAAKGSFEQVLALDEDNLVALKYLGMIEADEGRLDSAQKHLQRILSLDPDNKEIKTILHLVEEQEQIEQSGEATSEGEEMDVIDEILGDAAPVTPESARSEDARSREMPEPAVPIEPSPRTGEKVVKSATDELETSDELASMTLADIFAEQGYTSKAEKIYREVLRKQPGNEVVRARLRDLLGEEAVSGLRVEGDEIEEARTKEPETREVDAPASAWMDAAPTPEDTHSVEGESKVEPAAPAASPVTERRSAPEAAPAAGEAFQEEPALAATRPAIDEKDNLGHFKRWLTKLQK